MNPWEITDKIFIIKNTKTDFDGQTIETTILYSLNSRTNK